jgi:hypothetical protein
MSEQTPAYTPGHLFDPHRRTVRSPEVIADAFLECFTSPAGRMVWEALHDAWLMRQIPDERGIGLHDAFLYIEHMIGQGLTFRERAWTHEPEEP